MPSALRTTGLVPLAAAALLALAGCGSTSSAEEGTDLAGSSWGSPAAQEPHLMLSTDGALEGHDGCNSLSGTWSADGSTVTFSELGGTEMACPDVDPWLSDARSAEVDGDTMSVKDESGDEIGTLGRFDG